MRTNAILNEFHYTIDLTQNGCTSRCYPVEAQCLRVIARDYHEGVIEVDHSKSGINGVRKSDSFQQRLSGVTAMVTVVDQTAFDLEEQAY